MSWYYYKEGQTIGPVTETELKLLFQRGDISKATSVWSKSVAWAKLESVWQLRDVYKSAMLATDLIAAIQSGDVVKVQHLVKRNADVDVADKNGHTALHLAANNGDDGLVKYLLDHKASVNFKNSYGYTPLLWAALYDGEVSTLELLLNGNAKIDHQSMSGHTALHCACYKSHLVKAQFLIESNANTELKTDNGSHPIDRISNEADKRKYLQFVNLRNAKLSETVNWKDKKTQINDEEKTESISSAASKVLNKKPTKKHNTAGEEGILATSKKKKKQKASESSKLRDDGKEQKDAPHVWPPGKWNCPTCTLTNDDDTRRCVACRNFRPKKVMFIRPAYNIDLGDGVVLNKKPTKKHNTAGEEGILATSKKELRDCLSTHRLSGLYETLAESGITLKDIQQSGFDDIHELFKELGLELKPVQKLRLKALMKTQNKDVATKVKDSDFYPASQGEYRGHALVIANGSHPDCSNLKDIGINCRKDAIEMKNVLTEAGYLVVYKENLKNKEIKKVAFELSLEEHTYYDSLVVYFSGHGGVGEIYGKDVVMNEGSGHEKSLGVPISSITDFFQATKCPDLENKPKVFLWDCCRGQNTSKGWGSVGKPEPFVPPHELDCLYGYSSALSFVSYIGIGGTTNGLSVWTYFLAKNIRDNEQDHFEDVLTRVQYDVAQYAKQQKRNPQAANKVTYLTKKFHLSI